MIVAQFRGSRMSEDQSKEMQEIRKRLARIDKKLERLLKFSAMQPSRREFVPKTLSSLPEHLRKSAQAIATMGKATAEQVAAKTGRSRAAESDYLNQLASREFLKKERRGRQVYFLVFALYTICPQCGAQVLMTSDHCPMCGVRLPDKQSV